MSRVQSDSLFGQQMPARRVRNGLPTNDLVFSAYAEGNDYVFPRIMDLYVAPSSVVADVTFGKGVFWRNVPDGMYELLATDIQTGIDCRALPYGDGEIDCVVLDPPYMHSPGGTAHTAHQAFERHYRNNGTGNRTNKKYHEAVLSLYEDAGEEAHRVLRDRGVLIVKCQDEVCSNRQRFTHVEIMQAYEQLGFVAEDLFVVMRKNRPGVSRAVKQVHARKNHSYFLVFWKPDGSKRVWEAP
ncbi:MAG: DNA methyltransferase [bacterium]|nr:DNA methyltransferase [bacterium]MCY4135229.1 DNA methyltransferase [bacterium]